MLVLDIDTGERLLVQGLVRLVWPRDVADAARGWARYFRRSLRLWSRLELVSAGVRVAFAPGRPVVSVHSFVVPRAEEGSLRLMLAALRRTDGMGGGETDVPQVEADLAARFLHEDETRWELGYTPLRVPGGALHCGVRLFPQLGDLAQSAVDFELPLAYEAQIVPGVLPRAALRKVLVDAAALQSVRGVPRDVAADQAALAERLRGAQFRLEEGLAVAGADASRLVKLVPSLFRDTVFGGLGAVPALAAMPAARAGAFARHVHSAVCTDAVLEPAREVAGAVSQAEVEQVLLCEGLGVSEAARGGDGADPLFLSLGGPALGGPSAPAAGSAREERPFRFVSYARKDGELVHPLVDELGRAGLGLWMDRRLIGGEEWLGEIEARLVGCRAVLALVSPAFAQSLYCAREVHFADSLGRPIIPLLLAPAELARGLGFLLTLVQRIELARGTWRGELEAAVRRVAPGAWGG